MKYPFFSFQIVSEFYYIDSVNLFCLFIVLFFGLPFLQKIQIQEIHVPPELLESHDTDEMEMSDDDETPPLHLHYGKRFRQDNKVLIY